MGLFKTPSTGHRKIRKRSEIRGKGNNCGKVDIFGKIRYLWKFQKNEKSEKSKKLAKLGDLVKM